MLVDCCRIWFWVHLPISASLMASSTLKVTPDWTASMILPRKSKSFSQLAHSSPTSATISLSWSLVAVGMVSSSAPRMSMCNMLVYSFWLTPKLSNKYSSIAVSSAKWLFISCLMSWFLYPSSRQAAASSTKESASSCLWCFTTASGSSRLECHRVSACSTPKGKSWRVMALSMASSASSYLASLKSDRASARSLAARRRFGQSSV